jgi:hypothetical protein
MSSCNNVNPITGGSTVDDIPFYLAVQQGKVPGYSMINKFGYNPSIGSGSFETIWGNRKQLSLAIFGSYC